MDWFTIEKYCLDNGRNAVPPIRMFKYLLLKSIYDLFGADVVECSKYDMSFKYFLDMLISRTVQIALEKGIIKSKSIIVDSTYIKSGYNQRTPRQVLQERLIKLQRSVYEVDENMKEVFPTKNTEDSIEKELEYCKELINAIKKNDKVSCYHYSVQKKEI